MFKHVLKYLIYPKIQDIQKPALIIIGFLYWVIYNGAQISIEKIWKLVLAMFIFDFLAYQARYQINDIRGIEEDREFEHKNRLLPEKRDNKYELHIVKFSFVVAGLKILLSVGITIILIICKGIYGWFLLICLGILFLSSILYEIVRDTYMYWLIFVCVGIGYPLRFSLGFFVVNPGDFQLMWGMPLICFLFALWAYGSFASILCWVDEIREHLQRNKSAGEARFSCNYKKKHYMYIRDIIRDQFQLAENQQDDDGVILPLREKGRVLHPWNLEFIFSIIFLIIIEYIVQSPMIWIMLGCLALVSLIISVHLRYTNKLGALCFAFGVFGCKLIMQMVTKDCLTVYFLVSITQLLIVITYFMLSYRPQGKKIDLKILLKQIKEKVLGKILGNYIVELKRQLDRENRE